MNKNSQPIKFIIALAEHRMFGHMLVPYLTQANERGTFSSILSQVLKLDATNPESTLSDVQKQLVLLSDKYSDENLAKRFSKKYGSKEFFQKVDKDFFNKHVSPFIDKQIIACLELMKEYSIPFYSKPVKYTNIYEEDRIDIMPGFAEPVFHFRLGSEGLTYTLQLLYGGEKVKIFKRKVLMVADTPCQVVIDNRLYSFRIISWKKLFPFIDKEMVTVPLSATEMYMKKFVFNVIRENRVVASGFDIIPVQAVKRAVVILERGLDYAPMLTLNYQYGKKLFVAGNLGIAEVEMEKRDNKFVFYRHSRDLEWEEQTIKFLNSMGVTLSASQLVLQKQMNPLGDELRFLTINWLNRNAEELEKNGIEVQQKFDTQKYYTGLQALVLDMKSENDWFDLYAIVQFGDLKIPFIRLRKHILKGIREFMLPNGEVAILPLEWFAKYSAMMQFAQPHNNTLRFSKFHFKLLAEQGFEITDKIKEELQLLDPSNFRLEDPPAQLNATLRYYQQVGLSWMNFLSRNKFGACLADDMGLGKTLQTIGLLVKSKAENPETEAQQPDEVWQGTLFAATETTKQAASLIIVPTSLVHNWINELKKFAPHLQVYSHVGSNRRRPSEVKRLVHHYDIIISTYGTIRNDFEQLDDIEFNYLILDESQNIKNSESKTYQAVYELKSKHRLVLTGTPIENSLTDLWSQMNFVNPGLLGNLGFFKTEFIQPIEKNNDEEKQKQLQQLISPFILRRTKEEVAKDLPELTELVRICDMTETQQKIYEEQKSAVRNSLLLNVERNGIQNSTFMVLQALTKLRQLANHPAMVGEMETGSGKFDEVMECLHNLMAEKHKVLIFSSFVKHLEIFRTEIENQGWDYSMLTGQTRDRKEVIDAFQNNPDNRIFLISLKAGGVGLNLTSADYIFILDPWWNPAAEAQAVSRAHRIGQDKKVFVYRFITEETIEEKILALQQRKRALAELFVESNNPFKTFTGTEIMSLFD